MNRPGAWIAAALAGLAALLVLARTASAQVVDYPKGPEGGRQLSARLRSLQLQQDARGLLRISGRNHKTTLVPVICRTTNGEAEWSVTYETAATNDVVAEKLTIVFSTNADPKYFYAKAPATNAPPGEMKELAGTEANIPLGGSDFWLSDLGFQFYHWSGQDLLPGVMRRSKPCYVLESTNPHPTPGGYALVKTWIEKESGVPLQAEAYGTDGKLLKEYELGNVKKVKDSYEAKDLKINNLKTGSRTRLEFDLSGK